jgi:nucleoside-diphosphate-sugar epimerase
MAQRILCLGYGYVASAFARRLGPAGWRVAGTYRETPPTDIYAIQFGIPPSDELRRAARETDAVLISVPPGAAGDPTLQALAQELSRPGVWIGYLSTTGVYGDRAGGVVTEEDAPTPLSPQAQARVQAEQGWRALGAHIFRLPGIYGPGRSAFDRLRTGEARRIVKPGLVHARVHVDDIASALEASLARPNAGRIYNICDDTPTPPQEVITYAAQMIGVAAPPEQPYAPGIVPPQAERFYTESRRVSNARAKAELGWRPQYPSYREGLAAIRAEEG